MRPHQHTPCDSSWRARRRRGRRRAARSGKTFPPSTNRGDNTPAARHSSAGVLQTCGNGRAPGGVPASASPHRRRAVRAGHTPRRPQTDSPTPDLPMGTRYHQARPRRPDGRRERHSPRRLANRTERRARTTGVGGPPRDGEPARAEGRERITVGDWATFTPIGTAVRHGSKMRVRAPNDGSALVVPNRLDSPRRRRSGFKTALGSNERAASVSSNIGDDHGPPRPRPPGSRTGSGRRGRCDVIACRAAAARKVASGDLAGGN